MNAAQRIRPFLVLLGLLAACAPAAGQEAEALRGRRLERFDLLLEPELALSPSLREEALALLARAKPGLVLTGERKLLGRRLPSFTPELLAADQQRLLLLLARHGFPAARIRADLRPRGVQGMDVRLFADPGPGVRIVAAEIDGLPASERALGDSLLAARVLGQRFSEQRLRELGAEIGARIRERGYAELELETRIEALDSTRVMLYVDLQPGARYRIATVEPQGVDPDLVAVAARRLDTLPGRFYSPALMTRAQVELRKLQLFRRIDLRSEAIGRDSLRVVAELAARKARSTRASVGTWSDHPFRVRASWEHRNLFGGGRGLRINGAWSPEQQQAGLGFWWLERPRPRIRSTATLRYVAEREESYRQDTASFVLAWFITPWRAQPQEWRPGLELSWASVDDRSSNSEAFVDGKGHLLAFSLQHRRDGSDDPLDPHRGLRLFGRGEISPPGFLSDYPYLRGELELVGYRGLGTAAAAARLGFALASPLGDDAQLLPSRRLFAGGGSSMRGYRRRQLGPLDAEEGPLGGRARFLAGLELRLPLAGRFGAALFGDAGQVWARAADMDFDSLAAALGAGLLIATPVGPVRGDFAFNLRDAPDDWLFHFSIGHPW